MKPLKIYIDGQLDYRATYLPLVKHRLGNIAGAASNKFYELSQSDVTISTLFG
jgi:hypothetical protein